MEYLPLYGKAALLTLRIGIAGIVLSVLIGLLCAAVQNYRVPVLRQIIQVYIEISRNTPLLIQLFFIYYGLPKIGIRTDPEACGRTTYKSVCLLLNPRLNALSYWTGSTASIPLRNASAI